MRPERNWRTEKASEGKRKEAALAPSSAKKPPESMLRVIPAIRVEEMEQVEGLWKIAQKQRMHTTDNSAAHTTRDTRDVGGEITTSACTLRAAPSPQKRIEKGKKGPHYCSLCRRVL